MNLSLPLSLLVVLSFGSVAGIPATRDSGALAVDRHRVIVSTDIGGTDFDDQQSMVHLLLYADVLDLEGLISSPYGPGRKAHILEVIGCYERDHPRLRAHSPRYPTAEALRAITKQGETEVAPYAGVRSTTEGSDWIVRCARRDDPRPLHLLVWGGIEDVAQALHDAPDILPKLRVHFIGGPNKKWSPDAYQYIASQHPRLWMIESNTTYRGWFTGGRRTGDLAAETFTAAHAAGRGALGDFFARGIRFENQTRTVVKMGDSPTVGWLLRGDPAQPWQPGWGGRYVRAWTRPHSRFDRLTTAADRMEHCGILELVLPLGDGAPANPEARLIVENQSLIGHLDGRGMRFRFCPKDPKTYRYTIRSNVPSLDGRGGEITAVAPSLREVAKERAPFGFLDAALRRRAADAVARGIDCVLKTQIEQEGRRTAWCAQHDAKTLEPAWARAYEPPSVSGGESVGIVRFLMSIEGPSPEIVAAIEGAVAWFRHVVITGQRLDAFRRVDGRTERILTPDPTAPPLWARFYELGTNRPLYMDRDSKPNYEFMKVGYERRSGYGYHSTAPASLIDKDYPAWRARLAPSSPAPLQQR